MLASEGGYRDCMELLLRHKADINHQDTVSHREVISMVV